MKPLLPASNEDDHTTLMGNKDVEQGRPLQLNGINSPPRHTHAVHQKKELKTQRIKLMVMISMTFFFFVVELVYGYMSNSMALIADSFHMLSDVLALIVALACIIIANRKTKSQSNTFGWVRAELIGALVNGVFLLALCFTIFLESIERLVEPHPLKEPLNVLIVGILGLVVNIIGMFLFHGEIGHSHGHSHGGSGGISEENIAGSSGYLATSHQEGAMVIADLKGSEDELNTKQNGNGITISETNKAEKKKKSKGSVQMNMKGVYLHIVTDFIGSIIVILTASVSLWFPDMQFLKYYMDPSLSMIMVILIMSSTIPLVRETALILLQTTPDDVDVQTIEEKLMALPGVLAVHEFHVWRLVAVRIIATVHIHFATFEDYLRNAEQIKEIFHDHQIHSVTVQPEFTVMRKENFDCALKCEPEDCQQATCCQTETSKSPSPKDTSRSTARSGKAV
ncbi:unnamed protein product [Bursaphelenchus xylophilus]|uniref:(pine wood nematode) hypothetical protein n=1 Tax=Bursaphelenchus xylophilus TaxID=6326 RepID=A0A811KZU2_BURXY|nr:unnamed protein product [Bursaphelenchus xylophilus]CAG9106974.1 unnamed protein product [Bursaphelenchus xylophilus]